MARPTQPSPASAEFARHDARVRALGQANAAALGRPQSRRRRRRGEWLVFLDADDTLAPRALETLLAATAGAGLVLLRASPP